MTNQLVKIELFTWEVYKFSFKKGAIVSELAGSFTQYPLRLAWAVTVHKSQGKTFEQVIIDIGHRTFASGQVYVALSRCTSFEGITLKVPITKNHIFVDWRIYKFLTAQAYKKASEQFSFEEKCSIIKSSISERSELDMIYLKPNDTKSKWTVIPLTIGDQIYKGKTYYGMSAYCKSSQAKCMFRVDRIFRIKED